MNRKLLKIDGSLNENDASSEEEYEDEEEKDLIEIKINSILIQIKYSQLCKHSHLIRSKYLISDVRNKLSREIESLQKQYNIQDSNILFFFQLLRDESCLMEKQQYRDIFKLSQYFESKNILKKLKHYSKSNLNDIEMHIQILLNEIETAKKSENHSDDYKTDLIIQMEEYLIENIEKSLKIDDFQKLPISIIYQIIEKSNKEQIQGDLLYDFINKSIDDFYTLFRFLDIKKLSDDKLRNLYNSINNSNNCYIQYIQCNLGYIMELKEKIKNLQNQNSQQKKEILNLQNKIDQKIEENDQIRLDSKTIYNENSTLKAQLKNLKQNCSKIKNELNSQTEINNKLLKEINQLKTDKKTIESQIKTIDQINKNLQHKFDNFLKSNEEFSRGLNSIYGTKDERKMNSAILYLKNSSEKGNCFASYLLGNLYECGEGVEQNISQMIHYYEKSSEQGNSHGYNRIGYLYERGHVLSTNYKKAYEYYQYGSNKGNSYSINNLAVFYDNGYGVQINKSKALELFLKSAELGNSYALRNLAIKYRDGDFVEQDYKKAIEYLEKSAEAIDSYSFIILGDMYARGIGVRKNISKASEYYQKAKDLGDDDADIKISYLKK